MITSKFIILLTFGLLSINVNAQVDNQTKSKMFCVAIDNNSTAPNYIVIRVKNLKTGIIKEICTEAPFLLGALERELGQSNFSLNCQKYKSRYFEFRNDSALWNIDFDLYNTTDLEKYAKTVDIKKAVQQVRGGTLSSIGFPPHDRKQQRMFAHLMFNNGVMMTRGCVAGNICELSYFRK
jgi:hypothetical protein